MKRRALTLTLALSLGLSLTACGSSTEEAAPAETAEETAAEDTEEAAPAEDAGEEAVEETAAADEAVEEAAEEDTAAADSSELIGAELPEIAGTINDNLQLTVIGVENTTYFDEPALRIWFEATNYGNYMVEPRDTEGYELFGFQDETELDTCLSDDCPMEEEYWISDFYPGTTAQVCVTYQLLNDTDPFSLQIDWDDSSMIYDFDVTDVAGAPAEVTGLTPVTDTDWFVTDGETVSIFDVDYSVIGAEVVDGYALNDHSPCSVVRVTYEANSNNDEDTYIGTPFIPVQDGIELLAGFAAEDADTDLSGAVTITPGETVQYTYVYALNSLDPIFFVKLDAGGLFGTVVTLE